MIGDLPAGVRRQWRSWRLDRNYLFGVLPSQVRARYTALKLPILSLSFTDDEFLTRRNIEFRSRCEASLWPRVADWIDRHVEMQH